MYRVEKGNYHDIQFVGKDVYGFKEAYSIIPVKLTGSVTMVKPLGREEFSVQDAGTAICAGLFNAVAGLLALGFLCNRKPSTYQVVINGVSHIIQTNERSKKHLLEKWCRKFGF